jgi:hypothetical protein
MDGLVIVPGRRLQNYGGGNYKVVSILGGDIFSECVSHTNKAIIKTQIRLTTGRSLSSVATYPIITIAAKKERYHNVS